MSHPAFRGMCQVYIQLNAFSLMKLLEWMDSCFGQSRSEFEGCYIHLRSRWWYSMLLATVNASQYDKFLSICLFLQATSRYTEANSEEKIRLLKIFARSPNYSLFCPLFGWDVNSWVTLKTCMCFSRFVNDLQTKKSHQLYNWTKLLPPH